MSRGSVSKSFCDATAGVALPPRSAKRRGTGVDLALAEPDEAPTRVRVLHDLSDPAIAKEIDEDEQRRLQVERRRADKLRVARERKRHGKAVLPAEDELLLFDELDDAPGMMDVEGYFGRHLCLLPTANRELIMTPWCFQTGDSDKEGELESSADDEGADGEDEDDDDDVDDDVDAAVARPLKARRGRPPKKDKDDGAVVQGSSVVRHFFRPGQAQGVFECLFHDFTLNRGARKHRLTVKQGFGTSNLYKHVKIWHADLIESAISVFNDGQDVRQHVKSVLVQMQQDALNRKKAKLASVQVGGKIVKMGGRVRKEVALLLWLVQQNIAFHALESRFFKDFMQQCKITLDSKWTIVKLLPVIYQTVLRKQELKLQSCGVYSITLDLWTSLAAQKYLVVTYHALSQDFHFVHGALDLIPFEAGAFAGFIVNAVDQRIKSHGLENCLLAAVVSDSGANVKSAKAKLASGDDEPCFNHLLKSVWTDVLEGSSKQKPLDVMAAADFEALSSIVHIMRMTPDLRKQLKWVQEDEGDDPLQLIASNATRWEGRFSALSRFLKLKDSLLKLFDEGKLVGILESITSPRDVMREAFFQRLETYLPFLKSAHEISVTAQGQSYVTCSSIPLWVMELKGLCVDDDTDSACRRTFKLALQIAINSRLGVFIERPTNALKASCLDPRFAAHIKQSISSSLWVECWAAIHLEALSFAKSAQETAVYDALLPVMLPMLQDKLVKQGLPAASQPEDALHWWKANDMFQAEFFKNIARMYFCIPAGSASSEATFSHTSRDVTKFRTRLSDFTLEQMTVIQSCLKSDGADYDFEELFEDLQRVVSEADLEEKEKQAALAQTTLDLIVTRKK
jgi:hypothetical protein